MNTKALQILNIIVLFLALSAYGVAREQPKSVIIFDASGSMWGQVDGKAKISIAKEALQDVLKKWNPDAELGLTVYGHRTKGDCADIETLVPVGKIDKKTILNIVKNIQPKGKTPISASLRKVAKEMKFSEEKATIILISDGKESCDADPCATAKELEKQGIDFVAHVIGFNVDKNTDAQLECIAEATGGEYFSAKNATALNDAMNSIVKKVEKPKLVKEKSKDKTTKVTISAIETEGGKAVRGWHAFYPVFDDEVADDYLIQCNWGKECTLKVPLGKYIIKSEYNTAKKETPYEVKGEGKQTVQIVMGQTTKVTISAVETEGGKAVRGWHAF